MKIKEQFIRDNDRIAIISDGGSATKVPRSWRPILKDSDALVAIPDMHMFLYHSILDNFKFGAEALHNLLGHLLALKTHLAEKGKRLRVYQLGDLYELRFPNPRTGKQVRSREIRHSHPLYNAIIGRLTQLEFNCVYGNHDYELRRHPEFLPHAQEGKVHLEHGFSADKWYHFANPTLPFWSAAMTFLHGLRKVELRLHSARQALLNAQIPQHVAFGVTTGKEERTEYPNEREYPSRNLEHYERAVTEVDTETGIHPRICVVGHTHHPILKPDFAKGNCFYLDAGAWTDGRSDFAVITNSEVAICRYARRASLPVQSQLPLFGMPKPALTMSAW